MSDMTEGVGRLVSKRAWFESVITSNGGPHLELMILTIEWPVASQQEVGYDTYCPYVYWLSMTRCSTVNHQPS